MRWLTRVLMALIVALPFAVLVTAPAHKPAIRSEWRQVTHNQRREEVYAKLPPATTATQLRIDPQSIVIKESFRSSPGYVGAVVQVKCTARLKASSGARQA